MYAPVLSEHAVAPDDVLRAVKMLLSHDIVEIDSGAVPFTCHRRMPMMG